MTGVFRSLDRRFWRMIGVRFQDRPLESGSHLRGSRYNAVGIHALYLGTDHATAIAEYHQFGPRPGTLVGYDVVCRAIVDLTDAAVLDALEIDPTVLQEPWLEMLDRGATPITWTVAERLIGDGADGALGPSAQRAGGVNLVLWRWHDAAVTGEGAAITVIDPDRELILARS